ncbi:hypothetical protein KQY27_01655 [Methanobrevibacter sp. TMH8]|uniref:hypothetical protein n=1 Tax=Methanobrevibacter sp. TMH8 TaxID=2848611 RepID=UPI001CCD4A50|nr:hypothetical protein [Methanobrevibacter sp. TMH8]MBZ9570252.1 hypothetical protein [Methanobrevibacter sp. TMH8]
MNKIRKILISATLVIFLFLIVANVSAADLVVNKNTTHSDIDNWMKNNSTVKGNNLIFNTSKYDLTDTINVSKSVNIKSNVKTQINFNKNKNMFNVSASGITFSGLTLNHNGKGNFNLAATVIFSNSSKSVINFKNMNFNLNNKYLIAIGIISWKGNVTNSVFKSNDVDNIMIAAVNWTGNVYKSTLSLFKFNSGIGVGKWFGNFSNSKIFLGNRGLGIIGANWTGNLLNSNITSNKVAVGVFINKLNGKISNVIINIKGLNSYGLTLNSSSKGSISKSTIFVKKGQAVLIPKSVKISKVKVRSSKSWEDIAIIGPRVYAQRYVLYTNSKSLLYKFRVYNYGESKSKVSYLTLKIGKYKKTVKIKALKPGKPAIVKIIILKSYEKSKKTVYTTYTNAAGVKTNSKPWIIK